MDSMRTDRPVISEPVRLLMAMTDETVSAKYLAPILKMSESVIVKYAKDGTWDQDNLGKYVISGGRVKFFRKDFLEKCGFVDPEKKDDPMEEALKLLGSILEGQTTIMRALGMMLERLTNEETATSGN